MVTTRSGRDVSPPGPSEPIFPIEKLPRELRDSIWEEVFHVDQSKPSDPDPLGTSCLWSVRAGKSIAEKKSDKSRPWLGDGDKAVFLEYRQSQISKVCPESREVAERIGDKKKGAWLQPQESNVAIVSTIFADKGVSLLPMLPAENYLVFNFKELDVPKKGASSPFTNREVGSRFLELVLAAKDYQIKVKVNDFETWIVPRGLNIKPEPPQAAFWTKQSRLVSINDMNIWKELRGIASHFDYPWDLADEILNKESRAKMLNEALKPLERLWQRENNRRMKAGLDGLKPLPKIDGVVYLNVTYGGAMFSQGFRTAADRQGYLDMIQWGVL